MEVFLNGKNHTLTEPVTLSDLVTQLQLDGKFAIEINQSIIPRSEYTESLIQPGDRIEVVQAIGGG